MTLLEIINRIAENAGYDDGAGSLLSGSDITKAMITKWVNDRYMEELVPIVSRVNPEFLTQIGTMPNYEATGTVDSASTDDTLVASSAIFTNGMVGSLVVNTTDSESRYITGYTDTSTVTVDSDIDDDWDGDTIYVISGIYTLGGDATDAITIKEVGVKWESTDTDYKRCVRATDDQIYGYERGTDTDENISFESPIYIQQSVNVGGTLYSGFKIRPINKWDSAVTDGVYIRYTVQPSALSGDSDVPRLPLGTHSLLVKGGTSDVLTKLGETKKAESWEIKYQRGITELKRNKQTEAKKITVDFMRTSRFFTNRRA